MKNDETGGILCRTGEARAGLLMALGADLLSCAHGGASRLRKTTC
jgi:hypothetical protein